MLAPHFNRRHRARSAISSLRLLGVLCLVALVTLPLCLLAQAPAWWNQRGVLAPNAQSNDYSAVNQGQLKNMAKQAMLEMDAGLWQIGGAGDPLYTFVLKWQNPTGATNDFAPVNLGQLKTVAKPFYERLIAAKYTDVYPWAASAQPPNDYGAANIGQVKNLFAFDLHKDTDSNGLPDWWERYFFGHTGVDPNAIVDGDKLTVLDAFGQGINPTSFYHGQAVVLAKESGDSQTAPAGTLLTYPVTVKVTDANDLPLTNAPVGFAAGSSGALFQASSSATPSASLAVRTDASGLARAYCKAPSSPTASFQVVASLTGNSQAAPVMFTASASGTPNPNHPSPFAPTDVVAQGHNDGSVDVTWVNHTDGQTPISIEIEMPDGSWKFLDNLPPLSTSYRIAPLAEPTAP